MVDQGNDSHGKTMNTVLFPACAIACDGSLDMFSQRRPQLWRKGVLVSLEQHHTTNPNLHCSKAKASM